MAESLELFLVEDDDDVAFVIRTCLQRAGHRVTVCRTGADALMVLSNRAFHLVLLDHYLPDMSGLDLLRILNREGISTPVLMVTGYGNEQLVTEALRAGAIDYIAKGSSQAFLSDLPKRVVESVTRHRLQQTNYLLISALESARDGVFITDLQGKVLHVNGALENLFGCQREELLGQNVRIFQSDPNSSFFEEIWRTLHERGSWQGELTSKRKHGTLIDASLTVSPILDARGQRTHFVGIYRDIGERKQMEQQLFQAQKMQSVGTLAGGVAHEFNNLLAGIQGYATLALRELDLPAVPRQYLEYIVDLSDRAANLTRQLLAFARKPALSRQPTRMALLLESTADLVRHSLNIDVQLDLDEPAETVPLMALADANQLQQVLVNLCLNARDAMPQPQPAPIVFRLRQQSLKGDLLSFPQTVPAGDYVVIEVEDRGCGMSPDVLNQALDPFFTTKEVGQGTGLGLAVAFGIITGHQGLLTIDSQVGRGTCMRIFLPRLVKEAPAAPTESKPALEPENGQGRKILVVDDEQAVIDVIRRFLAIAGHEVWAVNSGAEALRFLAQQPDIDLVILDLMIPQEEGAVTFRRLREQRPNLPILLCTGLVHTEQANELLKDGASSLLRKPFRMNELWAAVYQCMDGTRLV